MTQKFALPLTTSPMEAVSRSELPEGDGWQYEPKWDGFRCLAFRSGADIELRAKSGKSLTRFFPEVAAHLAKLRSRTFVLDGELVIRLGGKPDFDALQMRLHPTQSRIDKLATQTPATLILFDALVTAPAKIVAHKTLVARRVALEDFFARNAGAFLALSPSTTSGAKAHKWLEGAGGATDGVVAKRLDLPYQPGERAVVKVNRLRSADCVVGGFRYASSRKEVGSLLLVLYEADGLLNHVGFTSTIATSDRVALTKKLENLRRPPGFTGRAPGALSRWSTDRSTQWEPLQPRLVVEVRYDHVTGGRFRHGAKLLRWRPDKSPRQCTQEQLEH